MKATVSARSSTWQMIGLVLLALGSGPAAVGQTESGELPKLSELRALSYQKIAQSITASSLLSSQDMADTIRLAQGYSRGSQLLPKYREPILTRGSIGVSVFRNASPSVVLIIVGDEKKQQFEPTGLGTGVVINSSGDILTNWHVIDGHPAAIIFFKPLGKTDIDNSTAYVGRVVAQSSVADLALLHLIKSPPVLTPISIGTTSSIQVAEDIHVIGHPKEHYWSYTTGVVSQIRANYQWTYEDGSKHAANVLQLQTAINPGNSGGPVLDDQGKLLGLIAMSEEGQNLDYAVAVDVIQSFLSNSASTRTRGVGEGKNSLDATYSSSHLSDGRTVLRAVAASLTEYVITDAAGKTLGLVAETPDGVNALAREPNAFGGFKTWSIMLPNGTTVRAEGNGPVPEQFHAR